VTYLLTPLVAQGDAVTVPLRVGIGAALFGTSNNIDFAVRAPSRSACGCAGRLEFYGELALELVFIDPVDLEVQGGLGFRVYL